MTPLFSPWVRWTIFVALLWETPLGGNADRTRDCGLLCRGYLKIQKPSHAQADIKHNEIPRTGHWGKSKEKVVKDDYTASSEANDNSPKSDQISEDTWAKFANSGRPMHISRKKRAAKPWDPPPGVTWDQYDRMMYTPVDLDWISVWGTGYHGQVPEVLRRREEFIKTHDCSKRYGKNYCASIESVESEEEGSYNVFSPDAPWPPFDYVSYNTNSKTDSKGSCTSLLCPVDRSRRTTLTSGGGSIATTIKDFYRKP